ncbi:MAG: hypothetical protein PHW73_02270 [Atribacterota bacterium]|nr:hypothetical protein [Atribacterota bacterium]
MLKKTYLDQFLTKAEQEKIAKFTQDEVMAGAVKKILLFSVYNSGVMSKGKDHDSMHNFALVAAQNKSFDDAQLGRLVRSAYEGINALELGFSDLMRYKPEQEVEEKENPAR